MLLLLHDKRHLVKWWPDTCKWIDIFRLFFIDLSKQFLPTLSIFSCYEYRLFNTSISVNIFITRLINMTAVTCGAGSAYMTGSTWETWTAHPSGEPEISWIHVAQFLASCIVFCRSDHDLSLCPFSFGHCLSFYDLRLPIIPLVSSNFSYLILTE